MYEARDNSETIIGDRFDGVSTERDSTITEEKTGLS
jgi:hypothetical protein